MNLTPSVDGKKKQEEMKEEGKFYSRNILKNAEFEKGSESWSGAGGESVKGGTTPGGAKAIFVTGELYQGNQIKPQPPNFLYGAMVLPEHDIEGEDEESLMIKANLEVEIQYVDGAKDLYKAPVRFDGYNPDFKDSESEVKEVEEL